MQHAKNLQKYEIWKVQKTIKSEQLPSPAVTSNLSSFIGTTEAMVPSGMHGSLGKHLLQNKLIISSQTISTY